MDQKKFAMPLCIVASFTWFGYHCGAGFASGRQVWLYANRYGMAGIIVPFIAWTCCAAFMYVAAEYSRLKKATNYRDIVGIYYDHPKVNRIALLFWDVLIFMASITAAGSCVAGCGTLLENLFGLPYFFGCLIFVVLMCALLCFGKSILERLGRFGTALIIIFFLICAVAITSGFSHLGQVVSTDLGAPVTEISTGGLVWQAVTYGIVQISFFQALSVMAGRFESRKQSILFTLCGFLLNCGAMVAAFFAVMAYYPTIGESTMPIFTIVAGFGGAMGTVLMIAYNCVLVLAYITTAGALVAGGQARYTPLLKKKVPSDLVCRLIVTVVFLGGSSAVSTLGLDGILTTINTINANCRLPIWFIPFLILGPISIHKLSKKLKKSAG